MDPQGQEEIEALTVVHVCVKGSFMFQRIKRKENKEWKEKSTVKHEEVGNIAKNVFLVFGIFLK